MSKTKFTIVEIWDDELGGLTIFVDELPILYGEGLTRDDAISDLFEAVNDLCKVVRDKPLFLNGLNPKELALIQIIMAANGSEEVIRKLFKL